MGRPGKPIRSDIGWSTADRISIFGKGLPAEILGHLNLGDMGFLEIKGRLPGADESRSPRAAEIWHRVEDEASEHSRPR